jgi:hypothetical protein
MARQGQELASRWRAEVQRAEEETPKDMPQNWPLVPPQKQQQQRQLAPNTKAKK